MLRPDGLTGEVVLVAAGRDLRTGGSGESAVLDLARVTAHIAYSEGRRITALETNPPRPALAALVGAGTARGFRTAVEAVLPGERERGSLLYQLFDDIPNALLISGHALAVGLPPAVRMEIRKKANRPAVPDVCAGWATGSAVLRGIEETGLPPVFLGPPAPDLDAPEDPAAWHTIDPLPPTGVRRRRRIDVWRDGGAVAVEAFFRDSHRDGDGFEEVIHEYTVHATLDLGTQRFISVAAEIGALPFVECPGAVASAERLIGQPLGDLRHRILRELTGATTCTHLNDTLRALEDLPALVAALVEP